MLKTMQAIRCNHALEHATITILLGRLKQQTRLIGSAAGDGFYLYGDVPIQELAESAHEGLARLRQGEAHLAVSPLCGTNLAVAGVLAGLSSFLAIGTDHRFTRLPNVITAAMLAVVAAQPLGRLAQKYLTTSPDLSRTDIINVRLLGKGLLPLHKVQTAYHS